ncbi:MAG: CPXCG motif-containing cysteine-rich protein [Bacteroidia bacterium]|nr:CPXCG motif-containing cysteine-rich protein [Bacteroidia bacterium]NND26454.1 CPXCG motif-containing cysteine-rich protein [Flavobacteriaceae bacterium]MBT8278981.1 CPXCG motif-containing cysteine-rich protein [Bacteroidia bacterium]NNK59442.1 CPXCG motif-containing cysteine-rich protein [Flavobacteriaceae bacterium]NNL33721.1 CPXCG motif-containing cysteine-rich protein [Flavobacteriaceae bacterium]
MNELHFFICPYCWEKISMLVDTSQERQEYIEDCEVCCNPISLNIECENGSIISFSALNIEQ